MDLFEEPGSNTPEFTVSEISGAVKRVIEGEFGRVRIRGEIGRVVRARTGHIYYDLKDDRSVIAAITWKGQAARLTAQPEEGMEVIASGKLTTYPGQSKYQIIIDDISPAGEGALMAMLERRKKALAAEGLFDDGRKRPLPMLPEVIGVVTSPTGAVIRDILHRLRERFPRKVLVWPVAVQGQACAPQVAAAIEGFNRLTPGGALPRPDLLIVARGGGSLEDLWGFNEEIVARAAAGSDIPLISAVGHETDTTLIDYVSDWRAPTPTAAAEKAVPVRMELQGWLDQTGGRMARALSAAVEGRSQRLRDLDRAMPRAEMLLGTRRQRLDLAEARLPQALERLLTRHRHRLTDLAGPMRPATLRTQVTSLRREVAALDQRAVPALARRVAQDRTRLEQTAGQAAPVAARAVKQARDRVTLSASRLRVQTARATVEQDRRRLVQLSDQLDRLATGQVAQARGKLEALGRLHDTLSHKETLRRGYAIVRADGALATSAKTIRSAQTVEIEVADGRVELSAGAEASAPKPRKSAPKSPDDQGSLF